MMTVIEQRRQERYPLVRQPVGEFRLRTPEATYPIKVIKDISNSGIRIYLDRSLDSPLQVAVEYAEQNLKLEVSGMVAWSATREAGTDPGDGAGSFVIGIQLLSPLLLMAVLGRN
jgi:hypothetical protein